VPSTGDQKITGGIISENKPVEEKSPTTGNTGMAMITVHLILKCKA
jgi:hypothetical protein